jgi:hypothetical protein
LSSGSGAYATARETKPLSRAVDAQADSRGAPIVSKMARAPERRAFEDQLDHGIAEVF